MRGTVLVALLLGATLAGCIGGAGDDALEDQTTEVGPPPPIPDGLTIQHSELVKQTETTATLT